MGPFPSLAFLVLIGSIPGMVRYPERTYREEDKAAFFKQNEENFGLPVDETFDYIIIGAGTAGSILARRLSEKYTVLLLEAGGDPPPIQSLTTLVNFMKREPGIHWFYDSLPQKRASLSNGGFVRSTAGKMLGGSGSHNNVQYERGSPLDFDQWAYFTKDDSWKFSNVLPYFLKTENYQGQFTTRDGHHATGGLLDVFKTEVTFAEDLFFSAGRELGYEVGIDSNGPQRVGFSAAEYNRRRGHRVSTYSAFIEPIMRSRKELTVRRYSVVSRIIIKNRHAVGVEYHRHGVPRAAFARREVILSGGAYLSPILLMRSGIGPADQLDGPPVVELPVGFNLQDHVVVHLPKIIVRDKSVFKYSPSTLSFADIREFTVNGTGFLAAWETLHEAFLPSTRAHTLERAPQWPDIQLYFGHEFINGTGDVLTCNVNLNRERSRGRLYRNFKARTLEESLVPIIDYNFFSDPSDIEVLLDGIRVCQQIVTQTHTFRNIGASFEPTLLPQCLKEAYISARDYWVCYIRQRATTNNHVTSTITMGPVGHPTSVVDPKLRVIGIQALRVVDASVMPFITNANINAAVMMIAEKAADDILADANDAMNKIPEY